MNQPPILNRPPARRRWLAPLALAAGLLLFGYGLTRLFELRFETGDIYPYYSTLRSDALGAKAFYEALGSLPELSVDRNYRPLRRFVSSQSSASANGTTLYFLGLNPEHWPFNFTGEEADAIEAAARKGARVVLTFVPTEQMPTLRGLAKAREEREQAAKKLARAQTGEKEEDGDADRDKDKDKKEKAKSPPPALPPAFIAQLPVDLIQRWGVDFRRARPDTREHPAPAASRFTAQPAAPAETGAGAVLWRTAVEFELPSRKPDKDRPPWREIYVRNGRPVVIQRAFGAGALILASDSYFLSNEALRTERHPALLTWLTGQPAARRVVFDETHFDELRRSLTENPGLMTLARRYRLGGALAVLGLLAALFIWKNSFSLAPPRAEPAAEGSAASVAGREAAAGFLALLQRSVPPRELIATCLVQWRTAASRRGATFSTPPARLERLQAIAAAERKRPAAAYRAMCETLRRK